MPSIINVSVILTHSEVVSCVSSEKKVILSFSDVVLRTCGLDLEKGFILKRDLTHFNQLGLPRFSSIFNFELTQARSQWSHPFAW